MLSLIDHAYGILRGREALKHRLAKRYLYDLKVFLAGSEQLLFPSPTEVEISVIIPVYNGAHHTLRCLRSFLPQVSPNIEIIVFDDASTDQTRQLLAKTRGLRVLTGEANRGFINAVNSAAAVATGKFLLLVNSDAALREGHLATMVSLFAKIPNTGAIGTRVALATGELQEAGCFILQNGSTHGYLRGEKVDDPRALFRRPVDYCSGVFLMLDAAAFRRLGGLNTAYAPAYYEETDLCMRLRAAGLQTIYTPELVIDHFEFGSQATEKSRTAILEKRQLFLESWRARLDSEGFKMHESQAELAARRLVPRRRLLLLTHYRDCALLEHKLGNVQLQQAGYATVTLAFLHAKPSRITRRLNIDYGIEQCHLIGKQALQNHLASRAGYYDTAALFSPALETDVKAVLEAARLAPVPVSVLGL